MPTTLGLLHLGSLGSVNSADTTILSQLKDPPDIDGTSSQLQDPPEINATTTTSQQHAMHPEKQAAQRLTSALKVPLKEIKRERVLKVHQRPWRTAKEKEKTLQHQHQ